MAILGILPGINRGDKMNREETKARLIELGIEPSKLEKNPWDLSGADLGGANLDGANLYRASLFEASLYGTSLVEASLYGTSLYGANLYRADLDGAFLVKTVGLTAKQLAQAKHLEHTLLDPGRYADAVAAGYKPEK